MSTSSSHRPAIAVVAAILCVAVTVGVLWRFVFKEAAPAPMPAPPPAAAKPGVTFQVLTTYPGMSAELVEKTITIPIERWVSRAPGVKRVESRSIAGVSRVLVQFGDGTDPFPAKQTIDELVYAALPALPPNTLPPLVLPVQDSAFGILVVSNPDLDEAKLRDLAQTEVRNFPATIPSVVAPGVIGGKDHIVRIHLDPKKLAALGITPLEVNDVLAKLNLSTSPIFRPTAKSLLELNDVAIRAQAGGTVYLRDVGRVEDSFAVQTSKARSNGRSVVFVPVYCQSLAPSANVSEFFQKKLPSLQKRLSAGTKLEFLPLDDKGLITISLRAPSGTRLEATEKHVAEVERFIEEMIPAAERRAILSEIGCRHDWYDPGSANAGEQDATIQVWLSPDRKESVRDTIIALRERFVVRPAAAGLQVRFNAGGLDATAWKYGSPAAVIVQISGRDLEKLATLAQEVRKRSASVKNAADVFVVQRLDFPELRISVDREKAAQLGLTAQDVLAQAAAAFDTILPTGQMLDTRAIVAKEAYVAVQYSAKAEKLDEALNVSVTGHVGRPIKLAALVRVERTTGPIEINRADLSRTVHVLINHATGGDTQRLAEDVKASIRDLAIPEGVRVEVLR